jgi:hypothetical protein
MSSGCGDTTGVAELGDTTGAAEFGDLGGPELIVDSEGGQGDLVAAWTPYAKGALELEQVEGPQGIPDFAPFNDGLRLPDGRILVRGRWDSDEPVSGWFQPNPDSVAPGEPQPAGRAVVDRPIRLFVVDPATGSVAPVSHVPAMRSFSTAVSVGEGPDVILQFVVLRDGRRVAYTAGFSGAAYDIPHVLYEAPIPPA